MKTASVKHQYIAILLVTLSGLTGCTGSRTFHDYARAGDTVAVAAGWAHDLQRENIEVTITDNNNTVTTYTPGTAAHDSAVRASINFYPDPVSSLILSDRLDQDITPSSRLYAQLINQESTFNDRDWWETVIFIDLPEPMALGQATITITDVNGPGTETATSVLDIVPDETGDTTNIGTGGNRNIFAANLGSTPFTVEDAHFQGMERADHYVVHISKAPESVLPHAIQVELTHAPDEVNGGSGTPYVINPIGHIKNLSWAQTGTSGTALRVIITPARDGEIRTMADFKFYVAGGVTGLDVVDQDTLDGQADLDVLAFDIDGNPITGITATVATGS